MKKLATFLLLVVFLFVFAINVNAASETILNVSKNEVSLGEEIILSIGLDTQNEGETSLYAYTAKLSYNKDVFEVITTEDFQEQENWSDINYNRANNKFALINKKGESGDKLLQVKLKVKEDAIPGETNITVNSIKASDGKKEIPLESKTVQVTVIKNGLAEGESLPSNKIEEPAVEENISIEVGKDNSWVGYLLIVLMVVIVIFLIYYIKKSNEKQTPSNKKMMIIVIGIILLVVLLVLTINILSNKKADVNADGVIDYDDAKEIIEYLLEIKNPQDDKNIEDKDINKDGKVDITDVAESTNQATNQNHSANTSGGNNNKPSNSTNPTEEPSPEVNYSSAVGNSTVSNLTPKKKEEITLDLHIDITPYTEVEAVECNGKFYQVTKVEAEPTMLASLEPVNLKKVATNNQNNHYTTTIQAPTTAGVQDIKITNVKLDNGKVVPTSFSVTVDVLKDKPKVENFKIDDKKTIPEISFNFVDDDDALKSGKFVIKDEDGNVVEEYNNIKKGQNTFTANLLDGKTYHYDFDVDYDLDHDYFSENEANDYYAKEDFIDGIFEDKNGNLEFTRDYGFTSKNMEVTEKVTKQEDLILSFENDYDSYYDVREVIINGTEYKVKKDENGKYSVVLPKSEEKGKHSITIQSVVLENGHEEKIDRTFDYIVLKDSPTIDEIEATLNEGNLKVEVTTTDTDETIKNVVVKVKDKNGNIVKTQELENKTSADIQIEASGTYTVEVEVTYDLGDGLEATITKTYDEEITEPIKANITDSTITQYVEKGGKVEAIYTIEDNTDKEITNILINETKLPVTKIEDGKYKVTFNAQNTRKADGKESIVATKVYYEDEEVEVNCTLEIEILKSEPTIEDLYIDDSGEKPVLHFVLQDEEKAFVSGTIIITDANESREINISTEETTGNVIQSYTLEDIKEFVEYKVSINITYDLDTDKENGLNETTKTLKEHTFEIQKNYNLTLSDFKLKEVNSKNVVLQFTSTNESKYSIEKVEVELNGVRREYGITRNGNVYIVEIPLSDINNVRTEITLEEIILSNLKEFNRETDTDFAKLNSVIVFKTVPTATIESVTVNEAKNEITTNNIIFTDTDATITKKYAVLKLNNEVIDEIEITTQNSVTFNVKNAEMFNAKTYTIEILATYNTVDGKTHEKEVISPVKEITVDKVAKVTAVSEKQYAEKGSTATVTFTIKSNTTENITGIEVNGEAPVSFEKSDNGIYKVTVNVPNTTGIKDYKITKIVYSDTEITISDSLPAQVYVLKDAPTISNSIFDDEATPPTYTFTFTDSEATLKNGSIVVKDGTTEVKTQELTTGENKVELNGLTKGKKYTLSLNGTYDLDDDKDDSKNEHNLSELLGKVELKIIDYQVTLNNVEIKDINKEEKTVTISFTVKNSHPEYDVTEIKIGENLYSVTKQENGTYTAIINYEQTKNEKVTITINDVKISNGKIIELTTPVTLEMLKKAPSVTEINTSIVEEKIKTTFGITDEDNTIVADTLKAELRDDEGNIVETKPITKENTEITFDIDKAGTYTVVIVTEYDLIDGEKYSNKILGTSNLVTIDIKAKIVKSELATKYPTKKQDMTIKYTIEDNTDKEVTAIEINGVKNVNVVTTSEDIYTVTYTAPDNNGIATITASKLYYGDKEIEIEVEDVVDNIDVLKSRPYLVNKLEEDFEVYEDFANKTIKVVFTVNDPDNACISDEGYVCLAYGRFKDEHENDKVPYKIGEKTTITFVNVENGAWMLHIYAPPLDLDSNKEDDDNHYIEEGDSNRTVMRAVQFMRNSSELHVANILAVTETKESTKYLDKNEQYKLSFTADMLSENNKNYYPQYVRLSGDEDVEQRTFELEKDGNKYTTKDYLKGFEEKGLKTINIESIILENKEVIPMTDKNLHIDVLKTKPVVSDFKVNTEGNKIKATFNIIDDDNAFVDGKIIVKEKGTDSIKEIPIITEDTQIVKEYNLDLKEFIQYEIKLQIKYDLDSENGNDNVGTIEEAVDVEGISKNNRDIEMKDIQEVYLYQKTGNSVKEIYKVYPEDLENNLDSYLVRVQMKDMPDFYTTIKNYTVEGNNLKFELEYENVAQYVGNNKDNKLVVTYGKMEENYAKNNSFASLIEEIKQNPYGTYSLTQDYDATGFDGEKALIDVQFHGILNGNGHTISNLSKPLFNELNGAKINDLVLENVLLTTRWFHDYNTNKDVGVANKGSIANIAYGGTLKNVHVKNVRMTTNYVYNSYGTIVGTLDNSATMENCSASEIAITGTGTKVGGLVGTISNNSTIKNSYAIGNIEYTDTNKKETYIGGIVGYAKDNAVIQNCITKINFNITNDPSTNGGIIGGTSGYLQSIIGNVSLSTGSNTYRIYGGNPDFYIKFENNYVMEESTLSKEQDELNNLKIETVTQEEITQEFFRNIVNFDESVWNLQNVSYNKLPTLKYYDPNNKQNSNQEGENANNYIPNVDRLKQMPEYKENRKIAYSNLYKIMPFYDSKYLVIDGNKIDENDTLNTKTVKTVLAYDENHNLLVALTEEDEAYKNISSIKVVFIDGETKDYKVTFKDFYGHVASYTIDGLNIEYNYNKYIIKKNSGIVEELVQYIKGLDYAQDLKSIASVTYGNRIYQDYFNETTKTKADEFVLNYLENVKGNSVTIENDVLNAVIKNKLISNNKLKEVMFAYNYYSRWYDINIKGAKLVDTMLFKEELYGKNMGIDNLTNEVLLSKWCSSNHTKYYYRDNIAHRTGIETISSFIDYNINVLGNYETKDDWFTESFKGILVEVPAKGHPDIDYRAWTQLKKQEDYLLPILTLPENAGYMLSTPTQFIVGSQRVYIDNTQDPTQREELRKKIEDYGTNYIGVFYTTAAGFIEANYMNDFADIQMDTPRLKNGNRLQEKTGLTQDPFNKNFFEVMEDWPTIENSGAYAQGGKVHWVTYSAINKDAYSGVWSHESAHNQAVKLFLKNNGRRPSGDTTTVDEDYPDGNIAQGFGDGAVNFNLTYDYPVNAMITTNLTPERINTVEKIESYYKRMFEAIDFLDYVEAQAFLRLTPEEQSKVCVQVQYLGANVAWKALTEGQLAEMHLNNINDIYNNKIMINPGSINTIKEATGSYGAEGMYIRRWYQPYNNTGRTYSHGLKYTAWQMLGEGGYDNGYITYYSGKSQNDLDAIKQITNDPSMTWDKYKLGRYDLISKNLENAYLDTNKLIDEYEQALKEDAKNNDTNVTKSTNVRRNNYHYLKRVTNDFREDVLTNKAHETHIANAQEFYDKITENPMGYYVLDGDIDFSSFNTENNTIIEGCFAGKLEGNNHKIIGNKVPVFNEIKFAHISNLKIEGSNITSSEKSIGALAKTMSYVEMENIEASNITIESTQEEVGGLIGFVDQSKVKNVQMSNITISNATAKVGSFVGHLENSSIENITVNKSTISATSEKVGGMIGAVSGANVKNIHIAEATVSGKNRVGGLIGYIESVVIKDDKAIVKKVTSTVEESSSNADVTSINNASGGLIGEAIDSTVIQNCYSMGKVKGTNDIGGLIGYINNSSVIKCFSTVTATGSIGVAGFVGQAIGNSKVQDNIALGNQDTAYKFDGRTNTTQLSNYSNNYEYEENNGISTLNREGFTEKIKVAKKENVINKEFYTSTLNWDDKIWHFDNVGNEGTPTLKCSDLNKSINIIERYTIGNVDEFIEKLNAHPSANFDITNDIDFSGKTYDWNNETIEAISVITKTFTGKINGNNHTIKNLENAALFEEFNGKVCDLNISNFKYGAVKSNPRYPDAIIVGSSGKRTDKMGAFAKESNNAEFSRMKFEQIIIFGKSNLGIVVANDTNSTFEQISVKSAFIYGNGEATTSNKGENVSTFIGTKNGGSIKNCYVQGELTADTWNIGDNFGGIIGKMSSKVTIENVISNVYIKANSLKTAGFVGTIENATGATIKNSASIGSGVSSSKFSKFTTATGAITFDNCYENRDAVGTSNANDNNIIAKPEENLLSKEFYTQTLGLDEKIWNLENVQMKKKYTQVQTKASAQTIDIIDLDLIF